MNIENIISAGIPLIHIRTNEYDRAIRKIIAQLNPNKSLNDFDLYVYSRHFGLLNVNTGQKEMVEEDRVISKIIAMGKETPCVLIMCNLEKALEDNFRKAYLVDVLLHFHKEGQINNYALINIGPGDIPMELRPYFVVKDFPLPTEEEIFLELKELLYDGNGEPFWGVAPSDKKIKTISNICKGMTLNEAVNAVSLSIIEKGDIDIKDIRKEKAEIVKKSGLLEWIEDLPTLEEVGGFTEFKNWIMRIKTVIDNYEKAIKIGIQPPKGILITGIPGTGKSLTAKALASLFKIPLFRLDVGRLFSSFVGETEKNTREAMRLIEALSPCVVLIDEVEKALAGAKNSLDNGVTARLLGNLLYFMQERKSLSYLVCTANDITSLPPEFCRKGRFDEVWFVDLPNSIERAEIWKIHLKKPR